MIYIRVKWNHSDTRFPVHLYSELDENRMEVRKVEVWADGRCGYAGQNEVFGNTGLDKVPIPSLVKIAEDLQLEPFEISREEFELVWAIRKDY